MYCIIKIAVILALVFRFCQYVTLYKYSLIVYKDLISFPCINLMSLFIKFLYFIVMTHSLLCLLLF